MNTESHYEKSLQRDIEFLRQKVLEMAMLDEGGLHNAIDALMNKDRQLAYTVILRDRCVDQMETELDRLCLEFLVRQQPVAGHLRFIFATIKIIRELERIGDYAESIARQALNIMPISPIPPLDDFQALAEISISMFHDSVQAFLNKDVEWARRLMVKEDIADEMRNSINARLLKQQEAGLLALDAFTPLMTVARRLERTSDQAKNICEEVIYMSTGEFIKHRRSEAFRILFVDSTNSSLSQMAEGIGRAWSMEKFAFSSAGLAPAAQLDPMLPKFLAGKEIGLEGQQPKHFIEFLDNVAVDIIVALNAQVRKLIPANHANSIVFEWLIADPCQMSGTEAEILGGYEHAFADLTHHLADLVQAIIGHDQFKTNSSNCAQ